MHRYPQEHCHYLQEVSMFLDTRDTKVIGQCSHPNHKNIIGHTVLLWPLLVQSTDTVHLPPLQIQPSCRGQVEVVLVPKPRVPYWLNDTPKLQCAHRRAGQHWREQKVVSGTYDNDVIKFLVHVTKNAVAAPASAQYY